jgi:L-threonylcarbamoyladenylate synthase
MKTKILKSSQIDEAVSFLRNGELVALPTETVYGLAADATNEEAVSKIFSAKGRPSDHPLIVHLDSFDKVIDWVEEIPDNAKKLADYFWPGPLTLIFRRKKTVSYLITGGLETIALRIPKHPIALRVIEKLGTAVAAPSANAHKRTSPTKPEHVLKTLSGKIAAIIDGGRCSIGLESTIIDITRTTPIILRPGAITALMIEQVLNIEIQEQLEHQEKVPGNMQAHYQPEKPLFLLSIEEIKRRIKQENNVAIMHYSDITKRKNATHYKMPKDKTEYARVLYETLYSIDSTYVDKIFVEKPPFRNEWLDINDRLHKASSK